MTSIVLTGAVGVGKSTLCEAIKQQLLDKNVNVVYIPEYLAHPQGLSLLGEYLSDKITNVTFQNFIMDYYEQTMAPLKDSDVRIFERTPDDSLLLFANLANLNGKFDNLGLLNLFERIREINNKYSIPSIFDENVQFSHIYTNSITKNVDEIISIIETDKRNRIVLLDNDVDTIEKRIHARARSGESAYDRSTIEMFCNYYNNIGEYFKNRLPLRFVDIGKFLKTTMKNIEEDSQMKNIDVYRIAFIGPVSVGKSTLSVAIRDKYKAMKITESNETALGSAMLTNYLNGTISDITFQEFIHDHYRQVHSVMKTKIDNHRCSSTIDNHRCSSTDSHQCSSTDSHQRNSPLIIIYDGLPDIGITCFSNLANKLQKLGNYEYLRLYEKIKKLNDEFSIPSLSNSKFSKIITNDLVENINEISKIIESDIKNKVSHRIIFLTNDIKTLTDRINRRGRDGEESYVVDKSIDVFYNHFNKLWNHRNDKLRFVDLGNII